MGRLKDIAIEIQQLEHRIDVLHEDYNRLRAWFISALLHHGGRLPKKTFPAGVKPAEYLRHLQHRLTIEMEIGGDFLLMLDNEPVTSLEQLLESVPPDETLNSGRVVFIDSNNNSNQ